MAESSGLQGLDTLLKANLKEGFKQAFALQKLLSSDIGLDFPDIISGYLDRIMIAFSTAKGLISLNSSASNFEDHANTLVKGLGGIDLGYFRKYVKENRNSCSQSPSSSARPRSRSPFPMGYGSPSNVFEGSVSRNWLGKDKQKCHEFADCWENERFSRDKERTISRKGKRGYTSRLTRNVPANNSEAGNDIPPEDGYTWRKYGHKEILGYVHPRMYYKCAFHNLVGCEAKKIEQRSNSNPSVLQVKYTGVHNCQRDAQFFENPFPISDIQERAMAFTGHSADQMYRFQGSEKEVSADSIPSPQQNEGPSNCQASLPPCGLSSASEANYMPPTNPRMQTGDFWLELAEFLETDLSSASDAEFWASKEMGMPPTNPSLQTMDTSESNIAAVVSTANSAVGSL